MNCRVPRQFAAPENNDGMQPHNGNKPNGCMKNIDRRLHECR